MDDSDRLRSGSEPTKPLVRYRLVHALYGLDHSFGRKGDCSAETQELRRSIRAKRSGPMSIGRRSRSGADSLVAARSSKGRHAGRARRSAVAPRR